MERAVDLLEQVLLADDPHLLPVRVVRERLDDVRAGADELAVELRDDLGLLEHDLGDERAGLQIPAALELEEVPLGADHRALVEPLERPSLTRSSCQTGSNQLHERLEVGRDGLARSGERHSLAHQCVSAGGSGAEPAARGGRSPAPRSSARRLRLARRDPPSRQGGARRAEPSSSVDHLRAAWSRRARTTPAARASGPRSEPLRRSAELAQRRLGQMWPLSSPSGRPVSGACRSLRARSIALVTAGARAILRKSSAAARGTTSKFRPPGPGPRTRRRPGFPDARSAPPRGHPSRTQGRPGRRRSRAAASETSGDPGVPRRPVPEVAAVEELAQPHEGRAEARVRPRLRNGLVDQTRIGGERLQIERARDVEPSSSVSQSAASAAIPVERVVDQDERRLLRARSPRARPPRDRRSRQVGLTDGRASARVE